MEDDLTILKVVPKVQRWGKRHLFQPLAKIVGPTQKEIGRSTELRGSKLHQQERMGSNRHYSLKPRVQSQCERMWDA